jgi:hypothetical protein
MRKSLGVRGNGLAVWLAPPGGGRDHQGVLRDNRHIGDFRAWKDHDAYQRALERLLRELRGETKRALR